MRKTEIILFIAALAGLIAIFYNNYKEKKKNSTITYIDGNGERK